MALFIVYVVDSSFMNLYGVSYCDVTNFASTLDFNFGNVHIH
jgi:hypothetical protein